ncbi:MAG TPA: class I SAM-dependent methyltransferase [Candidatus Limnocylindria bacterium]|nr:class I SAM-dependent methyltransferase [Candidatus Limnocylindria bacterium]
MPDATAPASGYDRFAAEYERWWLPVLATATLGLLDRLPPDLGRDDRTLVDVGSGTGILPVAALRRWPRLRAVAVDASSGMLELARAAAVAAGDGVASRLETRVADAAELPLADRSADVVTSSFMIQLVPDRAAVLSEVLRVLRPGATFAGVTWRSGELPFEPEEVFFDVVDDLGIDVPESGPQPEPYESAAAAADELRAAGFVEVTAGDEWLQRQWRPVDYLDLLEYWTADDVFAPLADERRVRLRDETLRRFGRLPHRDFAWRAPLVSFRGTRPD